ncbi:hypothetical protein [Microbacterium immunditiarum]|uniref:Putative thioredoxin/glutaredoxin n=1 Tax=Microbacterium immunditiarum TaxID=337480 RepID=A0A7Y9KLN0_9MICO|nr:hypothetical protein [Microbacterium immunditiarum]NYE19944.1 putative thioredoxin/glutaredoxin [Microbacterium immunditiarum]
MHSKVLETMPAFHKFRPEAMFGHWLMAIGAVGRRTARFAASGWRRARGW